MSEAFIDTDPVRLAHYDVMDELESIRLEKVSPVDEHTLLRWHSLAKQLGLLAQEYRVVASDVIYTKRLDDVNADTLDPGQENVLVPELQLIGRFVGYAQLNPRLYDRYYERGLTCLKFEQVEVKDEQVMVALDPAANILSPVLGVQYIERLN